MRGALKILSPHACLAWKHEAGSHCTLLGDIRMKRGVGEMKAMQTGEWCENVEALENVEHLENDCRREDSNLHSLTGTSS
jgi:hypothetical protein